MRGRYLEQEVLVCNNFFYTILVCFSADVDLNNV